MRPLASIYLLPVLLGLGFSGCDSPTRVIAPPEHPPARRIYPRPAPVLAAIAPDTVTTGQPFAVKVHVEYGGCEYFRGFEISTWSDTIFITPLLSADTVGSACPAIWYEVEKDCEVLPATPGPWTLVVIGAGYGDAQSRIVLPLVVGEQAAPLRRYALQLDDFRTEQAIEGAKVTVLRGEFPTQFPPPDTLAVLTTDELGQASFDSPCPGGSSGYMVLVEASGYYSRYFIWSPARCGVPERGLYRAIRASAGPRSLKRTLAITYR